MTRQPESFTVNLGNPLTPEEIAKRQNSHYSDEHARSLGYKRATVGGFIVDHLMMAGAKAWGRAWFERGEAFSRQRQPLYAGDDVQVTFSPLRNEDGLDKCDYQAVSPDGVVGVVGWIGLHKLPNLPSLADFPTVPARPAPIRVMDGEKIVGERLGSLVFNEPHAAAGQYPVNEYRLGIVQIHGRLWTLPPELRAMHADLPANALIPWSMGGGSKNPELDYDGSNIQALTEANLRFHGLATSDDQLAIHARISDAFERKGSRYFQLETLVVANGQTPIVSSKLTRLVHLVRAPAKEAR